MAIRTPECLFKPAMLGMEAPGFPKAIYNTIQNTDMDLWKNLWESITLSGGTTMYPGITERLTSEL